MLLHLDIYWSLTWVSWSEHVFWRDAILMTTTEKAAYVHCWGLVFPLWHFCEKHLVLRLIRKSCLTNRRGISRSNLSEGSSQRQTVLKVESSLANFVVHVLRYPIDGWDDLIYVDAKAAILISLASVILMLWRQSCGDTKTLAPPCHLFPCCLFLWLAFKALGPWGVNTPRFLKLQWQVVLIARNRWIIIELCNKNWLIRLMACALSSIIKELFVSPVL